MPHIPANNIFKFSYFSFDPQGRKYQLFRKLVVANVFLDAKINNLIILKYITIYSLLCSESQNYKES